MKNCNNNYNQFLTSMVLAILTACGGGGAGGNAKGGIIGATKILAVKNASLIVSDVNGIGDCNNVVYDSTTEASLSMLDGNEYCVDLDVEGVASGTPMLLSMTRLSVNSASADSTTTLVLEVGTNYLTAPIPGNYRLQVTPVGTDAEKFQIVEDFASTVTCSDIASPFSAASLATKSSAISLTSTSTGNLYKFNASGITSGLDGLAPYSCAWDPMGTGTVNTKFTTDNCTQSKELYVNYVGGPYLADAQGNSKTAGRKISISVQDACFIRHSVSRILDLPYTVPPVPTSQNFIDGKLSADTNVSPDPRLDKVHYLALSKRTADDIAANVPNPVQAMYGDGKFVLTGSYTHKNASAKDFGMELTFSGITDNFDQDTLSDAARDVDITKAELTNVKYSTDQKADKQNAVILNDSSTCTWTNRYKKVLFVKGVPCKAGETGSNKNITVKIGGTYHCSNLKDTTKTFTVDGTFFGFWNRVDSCVGGGGQGGGGIVPITN